MREIKFRAWDKETKLMRYLGKDTHDSMTFMPSGEMHYYNLQNGSGGDEYELMQFTGLKDKNGKDIFEGDIIHAESKDGENVNYDEVVEFKGGAYYPVCEVPEKENWFEVIGNIYENPNLLR